MIKSAKFIKGIVGQDDILDNNIPQVAFIGRSNVGKSSVINVLTGQKDLARTSALPGRTQEINIFLLNDNLYLVDLPGYGFAKLSRKDKEWLHELINWYLFSPQNKQEKIILIIDALVGPTKDDLEILEALEEAKKNVIIVANKIDKIKKSDFGKKIEEIQGKINNHLIIPFSAKEKKGLKELIKEVLF